MKKTTSAVAVPSVPRATRTEAEKKVLRSSTSHRLLGCVNYDNESAANLGDLIHMALGSGMGERVANNALRAIAKDLDVWSESIKDLEVRNLNPDILSGALYNMACRARAALELDRRFEAAGAYEEEAEVTQ